MTKQENSNFKASRFAPNPQEVAYWIDLTADPTATKTTYGSVKMGVKVNTLATDADLATVTSTVNSIISSLVNAGVISNN